MRVCCALAVLFTPAIWGQFDSLSTTSDGRDVYFSSKLLLKSGYAHNWEKLFSAGDAGVRVVAEGLPVMQFLNHFATEPYRYVGAEVSANGAVVAALALADCSRSCGDLYGTSLITTGTWGYFPGLLRLSPDGKHGLNVVRDVSGYATLSYYNLDHPSAPAVILQSAILVDLSGVGRVIANDGTAVFYADGNTYISRAGSKPEVLGSMGAPAIDASGTQIVYETTSITHEDGTISPRQLRRRVLASGNDELILEGDAFNIHVSDDGRRVLFTREGEAYVIASDGTGQKSVTGEIETVLAGALSASGEVAWVATAAGRLLRIRVDEGVVQEVVSRSVSFLNPPAVVTPGSLVSMNGTGFTSGATFQPRPPLERFIGDLTLWIGQTKMAMAHAGPNHLEFQVPWDAAPGEGNLYTEIAGLTSPFELPKPSVRIVAVNPKVLAAVHQDWLSEATINSRAQPGEVVHVFATGLGAVTPPVATGMYAPSAEPYARLVQAISCEGAETLFAGLAPGTIGIYQIDLRIGAISPTRLLCSLGTGSTGAFTWYVY